MSLPNVGTLLRGSGKDQSIWKLEWTYTDGGGAVLLDATQSDQDPRVATPVADSGTGGITNITFPKANRAWVLSKNLDPATPGTVGNHRNVTVVDLDAAAGTCAVHFPTHDGASLEDPNSGSRASLILLLEYT